MIDKYKALCNCLTYEVKSELTEATNLLLQQRDRQLQFAKKNEKDDILYCEIRKELIETLIKRIENTPDCF